MLQKTKTYLLSHKRRVALVLGCAMICMTVMVLVVKSQLPLEVRYALSTDAGSHRVDAPLELRLSQAAYRVGGIGIRPQVDGEWTQTKTLLGVNKLVFQPRTNFTPGQTYQVTLKDVQRVALSPGETETLRFTTETAPSLRSFSIGERDVVPADGTMTAAFGGPTRKLRDLSLKVGDVTLERTLLDDGARVSWRAKELLPQGKTLRLILHDSMTKQTLIDRDVVIAPEPAVQTPVTPVNFGKNETATIVFSEPIDREHLPDNPVTFSLPGKGAWKDDITYTFTPDTVAPGKTYEYTIAKSLRTKRGGILVAPQTKTFSTPGYVAASIAPRGEVNQAAQEIRVAFNQPVSPQSAQERVRVSHGTVGAIRWQGATMIVPVTNMGYQQTVTVTVAAGVVPEFGISNTGVIAHQFTTEAQVVKLNVPFYRQQFAQSCEAASLRMALAYRGVQDSDWNILQRFGYNPRSLDQGKNEWDDPQKQFVGDVRGDQGKGTGWGVYAEPVAAAARSYGRDVTVRYGVSAAFVAEQIHQNRPVILWGIWNDSAVQKTWNTPGGQTVSGPVPMHVRLVVGVKGSPSNPVGFYVHDPITGPTYWTASYLQYNVNRAGGANQAVAIH